MKLTIENHIGHLALNRPEKANSLTHENWTDLGRHMRELDANPDVRVIVLSGEGKHFCAGMDLSVLMSLRMQSQDDCEGRSREKIRLMVLELQDAINAVEKCRKPVIVAVHGACVGAGVDLITACDMRYSTTDAFFVVKEIDMGMVADMGTLQRLPKLIGDGITRELCYTGRKMLGAEAEKVGLVNQAWETQEDLMAGVNKVAGMIAEKSPLSIRGTKEMLLYARDHSVEDGLNYIATWNAAMILSADLDEAFQAAMAKRKAVFTGA